MHLCVSSLVLLCVVCVLYDIKRMITLCDALSERKRCDKQQAAKRAQEVSQMQHAHQNAAVILDLTVSCFCCVALLGCVSVHHLVERPFASWWISAHHCYRIPGSPDADTFCAQSIHTMCANRYHRLLCEYLIDSNRSRFGFAFFANRRFNHIYGVIGIALNIHAADTTHVHKQ